MYFLLLVSVLWALSFGLVGQVSGLGAPLVTAIRTVLAALVFLPFLRLRGMRPREVLALGGIGALQFGCMYLLYIQSYRWLQPAEVALFTVFTPLYVALAGGALAHRIYWRFLATAALAVAGTALCLWTSLGRGGLVLGFLCMQASNVCFALGQVLYRRVAPGTGRPDHQLMGILYGGGALVAVLFAVPGFQWATLAGLTPVQGATLLYLGVIASGLGFFLFNAGARRTDLGTLAIFNNVKVPLGVLASVLVFQGRMDWPRVLAGGTVIALALALNAWAAGRTRTALP